MQDRGEASQLCLLVDSGILPCQDTAICWTMYDDRYHSLLTRQGMRNRNNKIQELE
jgi:hypothetical protein